jgi:hypothetical protein
MVIHEGKRLLRKESPEKYPSEEHIDLASKFQTAAEWHDQEEAKEWDIVDALFLSNLMHG